MRNYPLVPGLIVLISCTVDENIVHRFAESMVDVVRIVPIHLMDRVVHIVEVISLGQY